jgi:hypothetical protein
MLMLAVALALELATVAAAPAKVAPIRFEDLVRYSDLVVVGSVVRIETLDSHARPGTDPGLLFDRLPPKVPFAELAVQRVLKGEPSVERVVYLATGTWTCDITTAELGERVLLFLSKEEGSKLIVPELRAEVAAQFPGSTTANILWSGRGRMPVDVRNEGEFATYWEGDVILPEDFPSVAGPEPEYDFIRSARVSDFAQRIQGLLESQRATWVRASVTEPRGDSLAWDLDIAWDLGVRLVIHEAAGDREALFRLTLEQTLELQHALRQIGRPVRESFGSGTPRLGVRTLSILDPEAPLTTSLHLLDDRTLDPAGWREVSEVLELWTRLRGYFEEPTCADHRSED